VEAESHFQAMTLCYEHMGRGPYTSREERDVPTYAELGWEEEGEGLYAAVGAPSCLSAGLNPRQRPSRRRILLRP
jgi:hypothetical protein